MAFFAINPFFGIRTLLMDFFRVERFWQDFFRLDKNVHLNKNVRPMGRTSHD